MGLQIVEPLLDYLIVMRERVPAGLEAFMSNADDFRTADRAGQIIGLFISVAVYGIVLFPMVQALL